MRSHRSVWFAASFSASLAVLLSSCAAPGPKTGAFLRYSDADLSGGEPDRGAYGANPIPIWSPLTAAELRAMQDRDKAAAGDPGALLGLAILASGDKRGAAADAAIRARVAAFVARLRPEIDAESKPWQKGFILHRAMHAEFLSGGKVGASGADGENAPTGYAWAQSRLTGIFEDGKYNCISSALLYIVLAREFGFRVQGVQLPSHAFVQLTLSNGKLIEVETTTPSGYDWIHDEAFYKKRAGVWFSARGLPASTFKDYQSRKILEPLQLVALNMANQHTSTDRMAPADRRRLIEARAWCAQEDLDAQLNRIALFAAEYKTLSAKKDWATLDRLYRVVSPSFSSLHKAWNSETGFSNHLAWQAFYRANTLQNSSRIPESFSWIDTSLAWARPEAKDGPVLKSNNASLIIIITRTLAERKEFASAEAYVLRYPAILRGDKNFRSHLTWLYQEWGMQEWDRKDWQAVADIFGKSLIHAPAEYRKPVQDNLATAYLNMTAELQNQGDWPKARAALKKCLEQVPEARKCKTWMD
jgi:tetratricopeptide (TPR) repeat protein